MTTEMVTDIMKEGLFVVLKTAAPPLIVSLVIGGITLLSLGIIGEYVGKIYMETKHRPRYIIDTLVWREDDGGEK